MHAGELLSLVKIVAPRIPQKRAGRVACKGRRPLARLVFITEALVRRTRFVQFRSQ